MASVQIFPDSWAAPRERIPQQTRRKACRNLFGPVDHEELNRDLNAKLSEISERNQQRWNFNFASGTPLQGDYKWEKAALDATPAFYLHFRTGEEEGCCSLPHTEAPNGVTCARSDAASGAVSSSRTGKRSRTKRKTSARLTTSTTSYITDFNTKRKKAGDVKERKSAAVKPLRFLSSEQTPPRKALR
ncbi:Cyclin-dependent kinase inhibitor 1B [Bagarius yarrelli]|uniref:Cyclin-dependent kinase inhibitor 1B n=1 Tax=Bagarius yarrelli TaxID=175774 RepID=A0A556TI44_BAGYA|nr:Cyclin-dependent kinase inhibitor 1B [Bagarius yarrelli]